MSQHNITLQSTLGSVHISAGFDPRLDEAFVTIQGKKVEYMSPSGIRVQDIPALVREHAHVDLPLQVVEGVQNDVADLRLGATDVGRRVFQYNPDGTTQQVHRW